MTGDNLARIERINLREAWPNEANDFTPWLAQNIRELGNALGVDLEWQESESAVGNRSLDIFATDRSDGRPVIIENQLEWTDNDHLSRLLIYAAGKDAKLVIWVARAIDDEHRQVLDWLNQRTDENTQFYGVVVELWKIDNSRPAPYFSVVTAPNEWRKQNISNRQWGIAGSRSQNTAMFHRQLAEKLEREHNHTVASKRGSRGAYCVLENLDGQDHYSTDFTTTLRVNLWFWHRAEAPGRHQLILEMLKERHQAEVEAALCNPDAGEWFVWDHVGDRYGERSCASVFRGDDFYRNPDKWDEYHDWIIAKFFKFREVFTPLLAELSAAAGETE